MDKPYHSFFFCASVPLFEGTQIKIPFTPRASDTAARGCVRKTPPTPALKRTTIERFPFCSRLLNATFHEGFKPALSSMNREERHQKHRPHYTSAVVSRSRSINAFTPCFPQKLLTSVYYRDACVESSNILASNERCMSREQRRTQRLPWKREEQKRHHRDSRGRSETRPTGSGKTALYHLHFLVNSRLAGARAPSQCQRGFLFCFFQSRCT